MITDEEYDFIADQYYTKIRRIGFNMSHADDEAIPGKVEKMGQALERIKEIRTIQRRQRGEE